jgi:hypothetical protein
MRAAKEKLIADHLALEMRKFARRQPSRDICCEAAHEDMGLITTKAQTNPARHQGLEQSLSYFQKHFAPTQRMRNSVFDRRQGTDRSNRNPKTAGRYHFGRLLEAGLVDTNSQ